MQYNRASRTHGSANAQTIVSWNAHKSHAHETRKNCFVPTYICIYTSTCFFVSITSTYVMNSHVGTKPAQKSQQDPAWMAKKWLLRLFFIITSCPLLLRMVTYLQYASLGELHIYFFFVIFTTFKFLPL